MSVRLLVSTGDPAGVGPEVSARAARRVASEARVVLFGDAARLRAWLTAEPGAPPLRPERDPAPVGISIVDTGAVAEATIQTRAPSRAGGEAQLAALDAAVDRALDPERDPGGCAVVTAPTSKAAIELAEVPFIGQTEHLARRAGQPDDSVSMMFLGPRLKLALATTHLSLRAVPDAITSPRVVRAIEHLADASIRLGVARPRIAVCALNPHAGERGMFGREDDEVITPAVAQAAQRLGERAVVEGPLGAETALRRAADGQVDAVVAMYHDQATIASKLLDWGRAVNVTWGLPFCRTSVDHGVAYDAAAAAAASADAMEAALRLAIALGGARR